jgi:hypothetical protein
MKRVGRLLLVLLVVVVVVGGVVGWIQYRKVRAGYDAYRQLIQQGAKVAGVEVGWMTPDDAANKVQSWVAEPYYRDFALHYQDQTLTLSPQDDLSLEIPVDVMVARAVAASHQYDYWEGFKLWLKGETYRLDLDVPFEVSWDRAAAARFLEGVAGTYDVAAAEPMVDVKNLAFIPGHAGHTLDVEAAAELINERVADPAQRDVALPVKGIAPDQSPARIESMLSTLAPVMARDPEPPSYYTATVPISTTGGIEGTPTVTYTGPLTWTFPQFAGYTGPLTETTGFFFDPGKPGARFAAEDAVRQAEAALQAGITTPLTFESVPVPPPPITPGLLLPPLKARLAGFPGVTSILVKDLDSGKMLYNSNTDYVLSGMSIVKIGIMVEVYRYYGGEVDEQTHQELTDMLGSSSCNPCANRLMAAVGGGSATAGANKVTQTMRKLGLSKFLLCAPFRIEARWYGGGEDRIVWTSATPATTPAASLVTNLVGWQPDSFRLVQVQTPRYDGCVRATPREMADLVEMIYDGTRGKGTLQAMYPKVMTPQVCQEMIDIMASNDLRNMLGAGIPDQVKLAHKHGFSGYDVPWGDTRGEVGVVYSPGADWLISFYIWQDTPWIDWGINQPLYRDVSNMLYNYFNPQSPFWPLPPWAPEPVEETASDAGM